MSLGSDIVEGPHGERARSVENVPRPILVEIVRELQAVMYVQKPDYEAPFWNKDKPFGARELDFLDEIMRKHGLAPE